MNNNNSDFVSSHGNPHGICARDVLQGLVSGDLDVSEIPLSSLSVDSANHCMLSDGVDAFCEKKTAPFAAFLGDGLPFYILGCWKALLDKSKLKHLAGGDLNRKFNCEKAELFEHGEGREKIRVLVVPPGSDITRVYGQACLHVMGKKKEEKMILKREERKKGGIEKSWIKSSFLFRFLLFIWTLVAGLMFCGKKKKKGEKEKGEKGEKEKGEEKREHQSQDDSQTFFSVFHVPVLIKDPDSYMLHSGLSELGDVVSDSVVVLGAFSSFSETFGELQGQKVLVLQGERVDGKNWSYEVWKKGSQKVLLLGGGLSFWGDIAYVLGKSLYQMGAKEILHCGMKVGTKLDGADVRDKAFCPEFFVLIKLNGESRPLIDRVETKNCMVSVLTAQARGTHGTIGTPLDESKESMRAVQEREGILTVDDEGAFFAKACEEQQDESRFGAMYFASDYVHSLHERLAVGGHLGEAQGEQAKKQEQKILKDSAGLLHTYLSNCDLRSETEKTLLAVREKLQLVYKSYRLLMFVNDQNCAIKGGDVVSKFVGLDLSLKKNKYERGKKKETLDLSSVITPSRTKVAIIADAGGGKSTCCKFLAQKWARGEILSQYQLLLKTTFRALADMKHFGKRDIADECLRNADVDEDTRNALSKCIDNIRILFVFDSLDEGERGANSRLKKFSSNLCSGELPFSDVIITSRWEHRTNLAAKSADNPNGFAIVALKPFSPTARSTYIQNYFKNDEQGRKDVEEFVDRIKTSTNSITGNPLTLQLICFSISRKGKKVEGGKAFMSLGELYKEALMESLPDRLLDKKEIDDFGERQEYKQVWVRILSDIADKGSGEKQEFEKTLVWEIAKKAYKDNNLEEKGCFEDMINLGVMQCDEDVVTFTHVTFQEFFFAKYLQRQMEGGRKFKDIAKIWEERIQFADKESVVSLGHRVIDFLSLLVSKDLFLDIVDYISSSALPWHCARFGLVVIVQQLLANGVDPSLKNNYAIRYACRNGHTEVVRMLLSTGAVDPAAKDNYAIKWASENGHAGVVALLLKESSVDVRADDEYALWSAGYYGHKEVVDLLSEMRTSTTGEEMIYAAKFDLACREGTLKDVKDCLVGLSDVTSGLLVACEVGNLEVVRFLLEQSQRGECGYEKNCSALSIACGAEFEEVDDNVELAKLLLEFGFDVDAIDENEDTALVCACLAEKPEVVKLLLDHNCDVNKPNGGGEHSRTPLVAACGAKNVKIVEMLVEAGCDVNKLSPVDTALKFACQGDGSEENIKIVEVLLKAGCDAELGECSPFITCCLTGNVEAIKVLIKDGKCNVEKEIDGKKINGMTGMDFARKGNFKKMVGYLEHYLEKGKK